MSSQPVDLTILDANSDPVQGVVVRAYSEDGSIFYTEDISDADGNVGFLLDSVLSPFQFRFFKAHWTFENPQYMEVLENEPNAFDIAAVSVAPPVPTDARLCTAFGHFRDITGRPLVGARLHFIPKFLPFTLDGDAVLTGHVNVTTDKDGYAQVNLIRNAQYDCTVQAKEDYARCISVPDQPNVSLPNLLLPLVVQITFSPVLPSTLVAGTDDVVFDYTALLSDGNVGLPTDVQWSSSDSDVLAVIPNYPSTGKLTLRPLAAGTADVQAVRADSTIIRVPDSGIEGVPHTVVVT